MTKEWKAKMGTRAINARRTPKVHSTTGRLKRPSAGHRGGKKTRIIAWLYYLTRVVNIHNCFKPVQLFATVQQVLR